MGITGLYNELGPGTRTSLFNLSTKPQRPLRLAIDISIWSFQTHSAQGGVNPSLRTLYYRLVRLLTLPIKVIFVFDGPSRPAFKRNKKSGRTPAHITNQQKRLLDLFGFEWHVAPGEAEAECAYLQKRGVVDGTLTEDVDTLMFGGGMLVRGWASDGAAGMGTQVTVYELDKIEKERGLTSEGMVLIALMSGGDYIPAGVPKCGIKISTDAAKAGFGKELCEIVGSGGLQEEERLRDWRDRLNLELRTNQSKFFSRKNPGIKIPDSFPDKTVLGYYLSPVVSPDTADVISKGPQWVGRVDIPGLRAYVRDMFEWSGKSGAKKLMRTLSGGVLSAMLLKDGDESALERVVQGIHGRRTHVSTDGLPELRVSYVPATVVPIDMDLEEDDEEAVGAALDDKEEDLDNDQEDGEGKRKPKAYDPFAVERVWVLESTVRRGVPRKVGEWEEASTKPKPKAKAPAKPRPKKAAAVQSTTIDKMLKATKGSPAVAVPAEKPHSPPRPAAPRKPALPAKSPGKPLAARAPEPKRAAKPSSAVRGRKEALPANPWEVAKRAAPEASLPPWEREQLPPAAAKRAEKEKEKEKEVMREEESDGDWIPMPKKAAPPKPASKPLAMADSDDLDVLLPPFVPRIRRRSPLPDIWTDPFQLPSSDPPTSQPSASDADSSASSQPVLKGKRTRLPTRPPSPIEVIDLSSSPLAAPASFSHQNTPIKNWGQSSHSTNPVLLSSAPTTPRCSPSPSKKLKTPETVLHNPAPQFEEGNSSLLYDQDALGIGYDENFGYFEQELEHPVQPWLSEFRGHSNTQNVESPISATSSSSSRFRRRSPPPQPRGGTGHINRILDFSSPPPVPPHIHPVASQSQTAAENERPNKEALQASALSLRRPNLTCITTLPEQRSLPPTPGTPHTGGGSGVLGSPVKNFNWITATRGNFSPRKQLKRVLEGVFLPSTVNEERKSSRKNETKKKSSESESESDTDENYLAQKSSYRSSCSSGRSTDSTSEESSEDEYPERDKSSDEAEEADRANSTPPSPLFTMPLPDNLEQALSTSEPSSPSFTSPPEKEVGVPKERPQPQRAISHPPPLQTPVKFRSMIPIPSSRCSSANSPAIVRSSTIPLPQNMPQKPPLYRNRTAPAAPKLAKPKQPPPAPERKNKVMLRQSSFGAWKDIPSGETPHKKTTTIWENVEVLDLTEAD